MRKIWNKGHRIRASDKHLVYHFSIGTLLFVFVAVLLLLNSKQLMRTDWEHFSLLENGLTLSLQLHNYTDSDWCLCIHHLGHYRFCYDSFKKLLHRQKLARMVLEKSGMKPIPYKTAVFLLTCKADQGKKSSGFQRFIIKWKKACFISAVKSRWENIKTSFYG